MERCLTSKTDNCKTCYKCIRSCPIKAISFENNRASIIHEDCVLCGTCYNVCPSMNSRRIDVGGIAAISAGDSGIMYERNLSILIASEYAGDDGSMRLRSGSA